MDLKEICVNTRNWKDALRKGSVDGRKISEWILKKYVSIGGIGLIWHRIEITGEPLQM